MPTRGDKINRIARRKLVFNYLITPQEERLPLREFLKKHKMYRQTFYTFEGEYNAVALALTKRENDHKMDLKQTVLDAWDKAEGKSPVKTRQSSQSWLKARGGEINEALIQSCKDGNAQALKLFFQLTEQLVEKQEVKIGLTADEIARRNFEAERELQEWHRGKSG